MLKFILVFSLLVMGVVGSLWIAGVIPQDYATDVMSRSFLIIGLVAVVFTASYMILKGSKKSNDESHSSEPGPKF